jgi:transposase
MYIDDQKFTQNRKKYRRILLRNSYRRNGRVCHDTIANLSECSEEEITAIKFALKHKGKLHKLIEGKERIKTKQGLSVGAVWTLLQLAKRLGITKVLGNSREAKFTLWMMFACVIEQGSRLSAVRLAQRHAACDILHCEAFTEDDLYKAMDWLALRQERIEKKLFHHRYPDKKPQLYLYDVTSSYFEGTENDLSEWGYNRDGKKGKKQIVIGLMTDEEGWPISIEVFKGNTKDTATMKNQIHKMAHRFGVKEVTLVGDRGMIKSMQIEDIHEEDFYYITAITKPQIEKMIKDGVLQLALFDEKLCEITHEEIRYILRRNPFRAKEIVQIREDKEATLKKMIDKENIYLAEHPRAQVKTAQKRVKGKAKALKIEKWARAASKGKTLSLKIDAEKKEEESRLDGCYVLKTDLSSETASMHTVHSRYKGLSEVEFAFRTMKTALLEMRGIFVRKALRTRAHVFIIMLAYLLAYTLRRVWYDVELTVEEGIKELASICAIEIIPSDTPSYQTIPEPREPGKILLEKLGLSLPDALPCRNVKVDTRKKLTAGIKLKRFQSLTSNM